MPRAKVRIRAHAVLSHLKSLKGSNLGVIQAC